VSNFLFRPFVRITIPFFFIFFAFSFAVKVYSAMVKIYIRLLINVYQRAVKFNQKKLKAASARKHTMGLLSTHEAVVWWEYHHGKPTSDIFSEYEDSKDIPDYVFEVLSREIDDKVSPKKAKAEKDKIREIQFSSSAYVSRVLSRAKSKIEDNLKQHANSHRLDIENVDGEKGLLTGFDYQANTNVYIVFTLGYGVIVWYEHKSYGGKLCDGSPHNSQKSDGSPCPKREECRETLDAILSEYNLKLNPNEESMYMTEQSVRIFSKLGAKPLPRYQRETTEGDN
jgi:hypothetical protein